VRKPRIHNTQHAGHNPRSVLVGGRTNMAGHTAFIFSSEYEGRGMSPITQAWARYGATFRLVKALGLLGGGVEVVEPQQATEEELQTVHSATYVDYVRKMDKLGGGFLDGVETPAYPGIYRRAALSVGGSLLAARLIARGETRSRLQPRRRPAPRASPPGRRLLRCSTTSLWWPGCCPATLGLGTGRHRGRRRPSR